MPDVFSPIADVLLIERLSGELNAATSNAQTLHAGLKSAAANLRHGLDRLKADLDGIKDLAASMRGDHPAEIAGIVNAADGAVIAAIDSVFAGISSAIADSISGIDAKIEDRTQPGSPEETALYHQVREARAIEKQIRQWRFQ